MILGGVFDRHPDLKLVMTEQWMDWAAQVIADMDGLYHGPAGAGRPRHAPEPPSEYFRRNCFIGASFLSNWEAKFGIEHDLASNTMWGDDYPHAEGTWPHTREAMRFTFRDIDPKHTRQYLGDTAIDVYGLDRAEAARRSPTEIGPTVSEVATPVHAARGRGGRPLRVPHRTGDLRLSVRGDDMDDAIGLRVEAVPVGDRRRGRPPPRARLGEAEALRRSRRHRRHARPRPRGDGRRRRQQPDVAVPRGGRRRGQVRARVLQRPAQLGAVEPGAAAADPRGRARAQSCCSAGTADGVGVGVRYYSDFFVPKLPSSKESRHGGNGPTAFHQDFITFAVDRSGGMTFWFPLEAYGPEAGTMSFVNGSHRAGVLGDYTTYGDGDALDVFPELRELEMSEPMTYEVGDITVHTHLTDPRRRSEHDGPAPLGLPPRHPAGRRLLERLAVPELRLRPT